MRKVYFYYPSAVHSVDLYKMSLLPDGFEASGNAYAANPLLKMAHKEKGIRQGFSRLVYPFASSLYNNVHIMMGMPKKRAFRLKGFDMVYSSQSLLDTDLPYVLDMEHPAVFCGFNQYGLDSARFVKALGKELEKDNLRKILPMSETARKTLLNFIKSEKVAGKTETLYPVANAQQKTKKPEEITFLFVGKNFYEKGGYETLIAFDQLSKTHDVRLNYLGPVPDMIKEKYSANKRISFFFNLPYEKVKELYQNSTCLVFPSKYDTLGFVVIEAFAFGLPAIVVDSFALPELVEDGKRGIVIKSPFYSFRKDGGYAWPTMEIAMKERLRLSMNPPEEYIERLYDAMKRMTENSSERDEMARNAYNEATEGRFSEKEFRKRISRIFNDILG